MAKKAYSETLKEALETHLTETEGQVKRLEAIGEMLGTSLKGKTCKAMQGLVEEGRELLAEESQNEALIDALLIGAAQRVEHYEIAGYGTARAMAEALGRDDIADLLQETLDEESATDEKLSMISEEEVLPDSTGEEADQDAANA
jgi:ferritin-like metal-binding protein YciE